MMSGSVSSPAKTLQNELRLMKIGQSSYSHLKLKISTGFNVI